MAALAISGCDKNNPGTPADATATNSSIVGSTNMQITNVPDMKSNRPNGSNISALY